MLVAKQLLAPIDFHMKEEKNAIEINGDQKLFGFQHSSKYHVWNVCGNISSI